MPAIPKRAMTKGINVPISSAGNSCVCTSNTARKNMRKFLMTYSHAIARAQDNPMSGLQERCKKPEIPPEVDLASAKLI